MRNLVPFGFPARAHGGPDGLAGGLLERLPEVLPPRIGVAVGLEIGPDRAPEHVLSEELLDHPEDRRSFAVTDLVEDLADLGGGPDPDPDRGGGPKAVEGGPAGR